MKKLVVVADDCGITQSITEGIMACLDKGCVTDVALMPNGEYFRQAVDLLAERNIIHAGVHLTAVDGESPLRDRDQVACLTDAQGGFHADRNSVMFRCLISTQCRKQLREEFRKQMTAMAESGLTISHISSHQHLHMFPALAAIVVDLARQFQVPFMRLTRSHARSLIGFTMNMFARSLQGRIGRTAIRTVPFYGMEHSGALNRQALRTFLGGLHHDVAELMTHPGFVDDHTARKYRHWNFHWRQEMECLCSHEWKKSLEEADVKLVSFRDLLDEHKPS